MNNEDEFKQALDDVVEGQGPDSLHLAGLSLLLPEQVVAFRPVWHSLDASQKLALLEALAREEWDTLRFDFNEVYHLGMLDENADVRRLALECTIEDDSPWLLQQICSMLVDDLDPSVRVAAATALQPFAQRAELEEISARDAERVREILLQTIHRPGEHSGVKAAALAAAGYFSGEPIRQEIEAGFRDEAYRLQALEAMGHSADTEWLSTLLDQFNDQDDEIRAVAAEAAGEIGDEAAVSNLAELVDDPALPVRLAAISALAEIGGEEARDVLVYALEDENEEIREAAEEALEQIDFFEDPLGA